TNRLMNISAPSGLDPLATRRHLPPHMGRVEDGENPMAGLIFDAAGNLYGTTAFGGLTPQFAGIVVRLTPNADGSWGYSVLHVFLGKPALDPFLGGLVLDKVGNLYGVTAGCASGTGCQGVVYEITQ